MLLCHHSDIYANKILHVHLTNNMSIVTIVFEINAKYIVDVNLHNFVFLINDTFIKP